VTTDRQAIAGARLAARYVESLGIAGASARIMDLGTFCAGRSRAIEVLRAFERGEQLCTEDAPYDAAIGGRAVHPDAIDDGECGNCCCDYFRCPHCGLRFRVGAGR
jgi:hypothetical protein